jgi:ABC-type antimicrobial peptide transport system permease subunit
MTTARRTREMGVRLALGATKARIVRLLLREQLVAVAAGIAVGSVGAYWAVALVRSYVYGITIYDPGAWAIAVAAIAVVAIAGTLIPARRASAVDPVRALRAE